MTVFRIEHQKNYVTISKLALENPRLSYKAKGLWAYCMSRPNDWEFHISHLQTVSKEGEDAVYSAVKELINEGYCERIQKNEGRGKGGGRGSFDTVKYIIHEAPIKKNFTQPENPGAEDSDAENPALLNTDSSINNEKENKKEPSPRAPSSCKKINIQKKEKAPHVLLSDEEHKSLILKTGSEEKTQKCYEKLSEWKISHPNYRPSSDYLAILKWVVGAIKEEIIKPKDEDLVCIIKKEFPELIRDKITIGYNYIEFPWMYDGHYKFGELGFSEKVFNALRKMGLDVDKVKEMFLPKKAA